MTTIIDANDDDVDLLDLFSLLPQVERVATLQELVIRIVQHLRETRPAAWGKFNSEDPTTISYRLAKRCMPSVSLVWPDSLVKKVNDLLGDELWSGQLQTVLVCVEGIHAKSVWLADRVNHMIWRVSQDQEQYLLEWQRSVCDDDEQELPSVTPDEMQAWIKDWRETFILNLRRLAKQGSLPS